MNNLTESQELTCKELVELVTDYLDGALSPSERERFEEHLTNCRGCRAYVEQIRTTVRLAGKITEDNIPTDAKDALLQLFRDWKSQNNT
jgi:anti-sigma factor RsiW